MTSRLSTFEGILAILLVFLLAITLIVVAQIFIHPGGSLIPVGLATLLAEPSATFTPTLSATLQPTETSTGTVTRTPFQPLPTETPTPTVPSPTPTLTASLTPTPTLSPTPRPTKTPKPTRKPTRKPKSTHTPEPEPPDSASLSGVVGRAQLYTLDCEARSAVDLAAFYDIDIDEQEFLDELPRSDDPESGFVGDYWDERGMLPPNSYGVHAPPVAALLRAYGLNAQEWRGLDWEDVQMEIASGNPVMVWVVGNVWPGTAYDYTASNGNSTTVTPFEHTVIVVGYDEEKVTVIDGSLYYSRTLDEFLVSWQVLGNMAITVEEDD